MGEVQEAQAVKRHSGKPCGIADVKEALSKKDAAELDAVLADASIMHTTIAEVLKSRGLRMSDQIVAHHRKGKCACPRG